MTDDLDRWGEEAEFALAADRLDTPEAVEAADPGDMLRQVASAAAQVRTALRSCAETDLSALTPDARPRAIVVAGLGASGTAGEMLAAVTGAGSPVQVARSYPDRLPGWAGAADVVIAVSCSGATAQTLAVAAEAARRGCRLACVAAEGSPLHRIAEQARAVFVPVPAAGPARSALWALAVPPLVIAERLGVASIGAQAYELTARRLEEVSHQCRPASESFVNPGKSLALDLLGALPVIWGTSPLGEVAARRFAAQLSLNAKYPAVVGTLPEAACSQLAAFDGPAAAGRGPDGCAAMRLVLVADPAEDQRASAQRDAVSDLAARRGIAVSELAMGDGQHPLVRLAGVIQLTDYASMYLAIASGTDPARSAAMRDLAERIE
ncbi:MAG TPA: SIS domain-containing protein [Streptosporangiaceae bacterium]|nr:SIS domain-containing protein [Streptosporangiaceae bacterium]